MTQHTTARKDEFGDSFGITDWLSTGRLFQLDLSLNCTGKQASLNTDYATR